MGKKNRRFDSKKSKRGLGKRPCMLCLLMSEYCKNKNKSAQIHMGLSWISTRDLFAAVD